MNGQVSTFLRKVATAIGKDPKYIKKHYKSMPHDQQLVYRAYVTAAMKKMQKEVLDGKKLPPLLTTNNSTG